MVSNEPEDTSRPDLPDLEVFYYAGHWYCTHPKELAEQFKVPAGSVFERSPDFRMWSRYQWGTIVNQPMSAFLISGV